MEGLQNAEGGDIKQAAMPGIKRPEKEVAAKKKRSTAGKSKRPKDYPRRPLSAYNIYFREERAKLLAAREANSNEGEKLGLGFETMAKTIGKRWKELPKEDLERFKELASEDTERYRKELDKYNLGLARKGRQEREEMARKRQEDAAGVVNNHYQHHHQPQDMTGSFNAGNDVGFLAAHHLTTLAAGTTAVPTPVANAQPSVSAQISQILAATNSGSTGRYIQELRRPSQFQDAFLMGSNRAPPQQQSPLSQRVDLEEQLRQSLSSRVRTNQAYQELLASIQPSALHQSSALQQRLQLVRALQQQQGGTAPGNFNL